jgi:hypothetical protein
VISAAVRRRETQGLAALAIVEEVRPLTTRFQNGTRRQTMKRVYVAQNQVDAQLVAGELRASGVPAIVKADTVAAPSIPFPSVWVEARDVARAREIVGSRSVSQDDAG